jgi:carbamate kinase
MIEAGFLLIACGGGGVPVALDPDGCVGVDAVIDKDLAAQRLASSSNPMDRGWFAARTRTAACGNSLAG